MGLKVWLPLNGDLCNQGTSNPNISLVSGNTWASSGKIGSSSLTLTKLQTILPTSSCMTGAKEISYAYWVKVNTAWSANWLDGIRWIETDGSATSTARQEFYTNCTLIGTWYKGGSISGKAFTPGVWTHLAATFNYNTGEAKFYINGTLTGTTTNVDITYYCRGDFYIGDNGTDICENDFRIYDHCLSAAEVREISQGLVLHYKLDDTYSVATTNQLGNKSDHFSGWGSYGFGGHGQTTIANISPALSGEVGMVINKDSGNYDGEIATGVSGYNLNKNESITFSAYVKGNGNTIGKTGYIWIYKSNGTNTISTGTSFTFTSEWQRVKHTITWTYDNPGTTSTSCYVRCNRAQNESFYISNCQLESGTIATGFTNTSREAGIIQDSSGYNYNGTILGNPTISSDTAKYISSTSFPANADGILSTYPLTLWNNAFTYSFWIKPSGENGGRSIYAASYSGTSCSIEKTTGNKLRFYWNGSPDLSTSSLTITDGAWQHIAIVKEENKTTVKCYYNGVLKDTFTNTFSDKTFSGNLRIARDTRGDATSYTGLMSDFRIYCTALNADVIRQLYEVGAKVDNQQNLHTFELIETNKQEITKQGQIKGQNLLETYLPLYDKNIYTEPDGSTWIHIFHHNNPAASKFNEPTLDWTTGKYLDADRWYDVDQAVYYTLSPYEFMVKQKTTSSATETKYRWIQTANPLTAVWADVKPGTVTFNTSSGYTNSSYGGMYLFKNTNLHMCIANGSNGNWYGGIGAAAAYNGGIPGYPNTTVTTGYIDLYIRVYNGTKIIKNVGISSTEFIEL